MVSKAEPLFLSSQGHRIFAIYEPPHGPPRDEAIVLCPPVPQEIMRSYQGLVLLGKKLAHLGYPVLRLDYFGTGDSDGDSSTMRLAHWEGNIITAVSQLKTLSGSASTLRSNDFPYGTPLPTAKTTFIPWSSPIGRCSSAIPWKRPTTFQLILFSSVGAFLGPKTLSKT